MIEEVLAAPRTITERADVPEIDIKLPIVKLTENWGKTGTADRGIIERYTANVAGDTVGAKLASLNGILQGQEKSASVGEILSTLIVVEILSTLAGPVGTREFTESAAGFIFEGFLAGLFGGKSVQIVDPTDIEGMGASGKPITDVILGDKHYSLKLLGPSTAVKGSFRNMVEHFKVVDHVVYLDARRKGDELEFSEFEITLDNFLDVFYRPFARLQKASMIAESGAELRDAVEKLGEQVFKVKSSRRLGTRSAFYAKDDSITTLLEQEDEVLDRMAPFRVEYSEESFDASTKAVKYFGNARLFNDIEEAITAGDRDLVLELLSQTPAYTERMQFEFSPNQVEKIANFRTLGSLTVGEDRLKAVWKNYADLLLATIQPVYEYLQLFTNNVNNYFLGITDEDTTHAGYGEQAIANAESLRTSTDRAIKKIESEN
jgi:hypothetical protein